MYMIKSRSKIEHKHANISQNASTNISFFLCFFLSPKEDTRLRIRQPLTQKVASHSLIDPKNKWWTRKAVEF